MSFETKNIDGVNFVKVDGEWIKEVNLAEMEQKLRGNINLLKKYNGDAFKTEDEINKCIGRQLAPERIELYYKAQARAKKIKRSQDEVVGKGLIIGDEFFSRMYAVSRQYGTDDQPSL